MDASNHSSSYSGITNSGQQQNGNIYGDVTNNHYAAPSGQATSANVEKPAKPLSTVPFPRDPDYVHRGLIDSQIHEKLSVPAARVALVGLGGVGKSQLAIEHAHRVRETSPSTWVLWIHCSSGTRFEQSIRDTIEQLKVPGSSDPHAHVLTLFRNWLRDEGNGTWLIILDNADTSAVLDQIQDTSRGSQSRQRYIDFLPACSHGSILITSRSGDVAGKIAERKNIINVEQMSEEHAVTLAEKKLGVQEDRKDTERLVRALDCIPLAIAQATAYISQRAPRCSVEQYVKKIDKNDKSSLGLLNRDEGDLRRDREALNSIILTWEISFEHIREVRPSAADLLSLMSFFDRQAIPEDLLRERGVDQTTGASGRGERQQEYENENSDQHISHGRGIDNSSARPPEDNSDTAEEAFDEDVQVLRNYSIIAITTNVHAFQMHRLVQVATRRWLQLHGRHERWGSQFVRNLEHAFPVGEFENWPTCERLFPHAMMALELELTEEKGLSDQAWVLHNGARYAGQRNAAYAISERMNVQSVRNYKKVLGENHPYTLAGMNNLALTYYDQGRWDDAEKLQVEVLETRKKVLGEDLPDTLISMANLASTYCNQGRLDEAEKLEVEVLETGKKVLGERHPETLRSMANLASTYRYQGRLDDAEKL